MIGPELAEFDVSLQREIPIRESSRAQFRTEAYNLLNHPNFNIPNRTAFTLKFGQISSAQDSRQLQFALKLIFMIWASRVNLFFATPFLSARSRRGPLYPARNYLACHARLRCAGEPTRPRRQKSRDVQ